jgi:hypothetical protein
VQADVDKGLWRTKTERYENEDREVLFEGGKLRRKEEK